MSAPTEAIREARWPQPGKLWSFWDMLKQYVTQFALLADTIASLDQYDPANPTAPIDFQGSKLPRKNWVKALMPGLRVIVADLPLPMVSEQIDRLSEVLKSDPIQEDRLAFALKALRERIQDELKGLQFVFVPKEFAPLYTESDLFGTDVAAKFPKLTEDIEAAGKCLALGLGTACVFHLMRVVEGAVQALSSALMIENVERAWGHLLADLDKAIQQMKPGAYKDDWSEARSNLYHVKQAWRNDTMHPKQTYTGEQAKEVFDAMRTFMRRLATLI